MCGKEKNMRTEVGSRHVYLSYCNIDFESALQIAGDIAEAGLFLWCDRLAIEPAQTWGTTILQAVEEAEAAILVVSGMYLRSQYCLQELEQLQDRGIPLHAIIIEDVPLELIKAHLNDVHLIPFQDWLDPNSYHANLQRVLNVFGIQAESDPVQIPEAQFLTQQIIDLEIALLQTPASQVAIQNQWGEACGEHLVRPRCHAIESLLQQGHYYLLESIDDAEAVDLGNLSELLIGNLLEWMSIRPQMVLLGEAGTGKTLLLYYLTLFATHKRLNYGKPYPLPVLLDLVRWDKVQDFTAFLQSNWPLEGSVLDWTLGDDLALYLDGLNEIPVDRIGRAANLREWLGAGHAVSVVVTTRAEGYREQNLNLPMIRVPVLPEPQVMGFVRAYLGAEDLDSFMETVRTNDTEGSADTIYHNLSFVAFQMMLFAAEIEIVRPQRPGELLAEIPALLWKQANRSYLGHFTLEDLEKALQRLAFKMREQDYPVFIPRADALEAIGNELLIQVGLYVGILVEKGRYVRFRQEAMQIYFAAGALMNEGLYTRLSYPRFDSHGLRKSDRWDEVIAMLLQIIKPSDAELALGTIAEVDPYLAFEHLSQLAATFPGLERNLIKKLFDSSKDTVRSFKATHQVIQRKSDSEHVQESLVTLARAADWATRQSAAAILLEIPIADSDKLIEAVDALNPAFPDSIYDLVASDHANVLMAKLIRLTGYYRRRTRQNAIWLLGEMQERAGAAPLAALLKDDDDEIVIEAAQALGKIGDPQAFPYLAKIVASLEEKFAGVTFEALKKLDRTLSAKLIQAVAAEGEWVSPEMIRQLAAADDQIVALALGSQIADPDASLVAALNDAHSEEMADKVKNLLDIMSDRMQTLRSRDAFNDFVADIKGTLGLDRSSKEAVSSASTLKRRMKAEQEVRRSAQSQEAAPAPSEPASTIPDKLVRALEHEDWLIRLQAVQYLHNVDPRAALPYLMKAAEDEDSQVRVAALEMLGDLHQFPVVLETLMNALNDEEVLVLDTASDLLKKRGKAAVYGLLRMLDSERENTLGAAIEILGSVGDRAAVTRLIPFLSDQRRPWMGQKTLGDIAAHALISLGSSEALQAVKDAGFISQSAAAHIIPPGVDAPRAGKNRLAPAEKIRLAFKALRGENWELSQKAARYLREYAKRLRGRADETIVSYYTSALGDSNWVVRWTAIEALAWLQIPDVAPQIIQLLDDENWTVQVAAVRTLVELDARGSVVHIAKLLNDENSTVREAAAEALGMIGNLDVVPQLKRVMHDSDDFVRLAAIQALSAIGSIDIEELLIQALSDSYSHVRWCAIQHLTQNASAQLVPHFAACLEDTTGPTWESKTISDFAAEALHRIQTPASQAALQAWQDSGKTGINGDRK